MDKIISGGAVDGCLSYHLQLSAWNGTYELGAVRGWAESKGSIYVVTGPVFSPYGAEIGSNGVGFPYPLLEGVIRPLSAPYGRFSASPRQGRSRALLTR